MEVTDLSRFINIGGATMISETDLIIDGKSNTGRMLLLAHGAGQGMASPFLDTIAGGAAEQGFRVIRFNFPYMVKSLKSAKKSPPDREPVLLDTWRSVIQWFVTEGVAPNRLVIGGKSMGGRMASLIADEQGVGGLVCLGYPFHPPGRPEKTRTAHLEAIRAPTLICQGERDTFGRPEEVAGYRLSDRIRIQWIPDGDHSFKPRKASGLDQATNLRSAIEATVKFIEGLQD